MHPILSKIDDLDAAIGASPDLKMPAARTARSVLSAFRRDLAFDLQPPAPGSTETVGGAKITHRPDLVDAERARQAAMQDDADRGMYAPLREALSKDATHIDATGGFKQAPEPGKPAEPATIGMKTR